MYMLVITETNCVYCEIEFLVKKGKHGYFVFTFGKWSSLFVYVGVLQPVLWALIFLLTVHEGSFVFFICDYAASCNPFYLVQMQGPAWLSGTVFDS